MPDPSPGADVAADIAADIVQKIIEDLRGRSGLDHMWESIDEDIQEEIASAWVRIAGDRLRAAASSSASSPSVNAAAQVEPAQVEPAQPSRCEGWYVDFQGARRSCLAGAEGCGLLNCPADHGPEGGW